MSTCARCGGPLTSDHTCHGLLAVALQWVADVVLGGLIGAVAGLIVFGQALGAVTGESFYVIGLAAGPAVGIGVARMLRKLARASGFGFHS